MPEFLPGSFFSGILTVALVGLLRLRAGMPRLAAWKLVVIGVVAAYAIPWALRLGAGAWRAVPGLPALPVITFDQILFGSWVLFLVLLATHRRGRPPAVPFWGGLLAAAAFAVLLPPVLYLATGNYSRLSLRTDVNHCTRGMTGQVQPREVANSCDEPIVVGLCLPGEINPVPCAQTAIIEPGQTARFDPADATLSALPTNLDGLTIVACPPPARPSRMGTTIGRGYEGVCLPPA